MPNITDLTYYERGVIKFPCVGQIEDKDQDYLHAIDQYERLFLSSIFPPSFYKNIIESIDNLDNPDNKIYKDLIDGIIYTNEGEEYSWEGLRGFNKNSLLSAFVFCSYLGEVSNGFLNTSNGISTVDLKGTENINNSPLFVDVWNDKFICKVKDIEKEDSYTVYYTPKGIGIDYSYQSNLSYNVTLYKFLNDHKDVYTFNESYFNVLEGKNYFGI